MKIDQLQNLINEKTKPAFLIGVGSILLFALAIRFRYLPLLIPSGMMVIITYIRFRRNFLIYKQQQTKLKRRKGAINVGGTEVLDQHDSNKLDV